MISGNVRSMTITNIDLPVQVDDLKRLLEMFIASAKKQGKAKEMPDSCAYPVELVECSS